jgi:hypothetical protein
MLRKTASKWPAAAPPASDAGSDATLSDPPVASGLVPDENLMFSHTLLLTLAQLVHERICHCEARQLLGGPRESPS